MLQTRTTDFQIVIAQLRATIAARAPELLRDYDVYAGEAVFGRFWLEAELKHLALGSPILEVGAGMFLLACQLQREGYAVTALEPVGSGFGHFNKLQQLVLEQATQDQCVPEILTCPAEDLQSENRFAFAYSLNVMEHVADVGVVMQRVFAALQSGKRYCFVCPNYRFPFETHFRIPIVLSKSLTFRLLKKKIVNATDLGDPLGLWASLNWITVRQLQVLGKTLGAKPVFNRRILNVYLDRALQDPSFCARHPLINRVIEVMRTLGLLRAFSLIPTPWMPVIDCSVAKPYA